MVEIDWEFLGYFLGYFYLENDAKSGENTPKNTPPNFYFSILFNKLNMLSPIEKPVSIASHAEDTGSSPVGTTNTSINNHSLRLSHCVAAVFCYPAQA